MQISGKWVIAGILTVAVLSAGAGWWYRWNSTHRSAEFWGTEGVRLLQLPEKVTVYRLENLPETENTKVLPEESLFEFRRPSDKEHRALITETKNLTRAQGITHLRQALLEDVGYDWSVKNVPKEIDWKIALEFERDGSTLFVLFSEKNAWLLQWQEKTAQSSSLRLKSHLAKALRRYFDDNFPEQNEE